MKSTPLFLLLIGLVVVLSAGSGCSRESKRDRHLARADRFFTAGQYEKAEIEYRNALRLDSSNAQAIHRMARIFAEQGSVLRALQVMQSVDLQPNDPVLECRLAEFHLSTGERETARRDLLSLLERHPNHPEALRLLAASAVTPEEQDEVLTTLDRLEQGQPGSAPIALARSMILLQQGNQEAAEQLARRALELDPKLAEAHLQIGQIEFQRGNREAAEAAFVAAARLAPVRSPIRIAFAQSRLALGQLEEARAVLAEVLQQAPDYNPAALWLARLELQEGNHAAALSLTDRILVRDPINLDARQLRSQLHVALRQPEKAVLEWEQFDQSVRPTPLIKLQVARSHLANNDATKAIANLDQAIRLGSNRLDTIDIQARLLRARLDLQDGRATAAVQSLGELLTQTNVLDARLLLVDALRGAGRLNEAVASCRSLIQDAPTNATFHFLLGRLLREQRQTDEARQSLLRSLELAPGNLLTLYQLVDLEIAATNAPAALDLVHAELAARTNSAPLRFLEGRALAADSRFAEAEAALTESIALNPAFTSSYQLLSSIHLANQNLPAAARELEALVTRRTNEVAAIMMLASLYERMDQPERARDKYEQVITVNPGFAPALNNLAYLYSKRIPRLDRALELAQRARQIAPQDPAIADTLGWVLHLRGDTQRALPLLREAADKLPGEPEVQYHLGMALYMTGQPEPARLALQRAVAAENDFPGKDEARIQLALLEDTGGPGAADLATLERRVQEQPRDLTARNRLASLYDQNQDANRAALQYEEILRQDPRAGHAALRLAQLHAGPLNQPARALAFARQARDISPADPAPAALLGRLLFVSGDHSQAYGLLQNAARQLPTDPAVQGDFAWAAYSVGRVEDADRAMRRALEIDPDFPQAGAARAFVAMTAIALKPGDSPDAAALIQSVLERDPAHVPALMAQAALERSRGNAAEAVPLYEKVLARFPAFTPAMRELGLLMATAPAQASRAYDLLLKVREADRNDLEVTVALARLAYGRQDYRYVQTLAQDVLRARPDHPEGLYLLGMAQHQTRDITAARQHLEKALAAGLSEPLRAEAQRVLDSLQ